MNTLTFDNQIISYLECFLRISLRGKKDLPDPTERVSSSEDFTGMDAFEIIKNLHNITLIVRRFQVIQIY